MIKKKKGMKQLSASCELAKKINSGLCVCVCVFESLNRIQLFSNPMDWSPSGSSVHGNHQARILE